MNDNIESEANGCKVWLFDIKNCFLIKDRKNKLDILKKSYYKKHETNRTDLDS